MHSAGSLEFPKPRYPQPIVMDPAGFQWRPVEASLGVERKHLGTFTERGTWVEMLRFIPSATWRSTSAEARRLLFVLAGDGTCGSAHPHALGGADRCRRAGDAHRDQPDGGPADRPADAAGRRAHRGGG